MSSKKLLGFLIILFTLLIFSQSALGVSEDFSLSAQKQELDACSCGLTATTYTIRNTGSVTSTYEMFKSGSAAPYSTFSESFFVLEPGQAKEIINYINLPCDVEGKLKEEINVTTTFGLSKVFEQVINTGRCANFEITPTESSQVSCPCSPVQYQVYVKNLGSYDEIFRVNVTEFSEFASVSENNFLLRPNQNKTLTVFFNLPCEIFGKQELAVDITTEKSRYLAHVPLELNIRECYDYAIQGDSSFRVCEGESASSPITITNNADFSNEFVIETTEDYASVENNSIFLFPNETGLTNLIVSTSDLKVGNYSFDIISTSERGESQKAIFANLAVEKCRAFVFNIIRPEQELIASNSYDYIVEIENTGTREGTFNLEVEGPEWLVPEEEQVTISSGDKAEVILNADIPSEFSGKTPARVTVKEDWIAESQKITLDVISVEEAYDLEFDLLVDAIRYDFADVNVSIKNKGVAQATYHLSLEGSGWMNLSQNEITLAPGEAKTAVIQTSPSDEIPEGKYAMTLTAALPQAGIGYSKDFKVKLFSSTVYEKLYNIAVPFLAANWLYLALGAAAIVLLIFLIWLIRKMVKKIREKRKLKKEMEPVKVVEEKKPATYQPTFLPFTTPTMVPEEGPRLSVPKKVKAKKKLNWSKFFSILFLIIVLAGVVALIVLNWGFISGLFGAMVPAANLTNQTNASNQTFPAAPEIEINRSTGVEGEGKVIYVREDGLLDVPVIIKNNAPSEVVYTINNVNTSWITSDKNTLSLDVNETETLHLLINTTPDLPDGIYEVTLGLNINETDLQYAESIELRIQREKSFLMKYLPYIIAGIALAIALIIILALTRKSRFDAAGSKKADVKIKKGREKGAHPGLVWKIVLIGIIAAVIAGTAYYVTTLPEKPGQYYGSTLNMTNPADEIIGVEMGPGDKVVVPFIFSNEFARAATYNIDTSADWISATGSVFVIPKGGIKRVNITAAPDSNVTEGVYNATVEVSVPSEDIEYTKTVAFILQDRIPGDILLKNKFFVIGAAIIVVGLLLLLVFKKRRKEKREFLAEIRQEIEAEKGKRKKASKTDIAPKKKPSKKRKK